MASRVAHEHPTLVFTFVYFALTAVGLIYDLWFFFYFKINILDYSETGDFLLAASAAVFIAIYAAVFTQIYVEIVAYRVKRGNGQRVMVTRNTGATPAERPILLGTTTRFFFLY